MLNGTIIYINIIWPSSIFSLGLYVISEPTRSCVLSSLLKIYKKCFSKNSENTTQNGNIIHCILQMKSLQIFFFMFIHFRHRSVSFISLMLAYLMAEMCTKKYNKRQHLSLLLKKHHWGVERYPWNATLPQLSCITLQPKPSLCPCRYWNHQIASTKVPQHKFPT
jgi:hypothetical protein